MHYRMESLGDELVIRNVETNRRAGTVVPFCIVQWHDPDRREIRGCDVFNNQGDKLAWIIVEGALGKAAVAVANYEVAYPPRWKRKSCSTEFNKSSVYGVLGVGQNSLGQWVICRNGCHLVDGKGRFACFPTAAQAKRAANAHLRDGYPGSKSRKDGLSWEKGGGPEPEFVEHRLGTLLADAISAFARGFIECRSGGLKAETKSRCAQLIEEIYAIWHASRFGCFDNERRVHGPYFAGLTAAHPRISFGAAAQHYGMRELRSRFPDIAEATLKELLSWPLDLLARALDGSWQ